MSHDGHHGHHMPPSDAVMTTPTDHSGHLAVMAADGGGSAPVGGGMHSMMAMYFHFGFENYILFQQWTAQTVTSLVLTCVFFFLLAILYEILKAYRRVVALRFQLGHTSTTHLVHGPGHRHRHSAGHSGPGGDLGAGGDGSAGSSLSAVSTGNGHQKLVPESGTSSMYVMDPSAPTPDDPTVQVIQSAHPSYGLQQSSGPGSPGHLSTQSAGIPIFSSRREMFSIGHLLSTLLYMLQVLFAYLLMLAFMLFNVWLCAAILLGAAFGHFLLAHKAIALQDHANEDYCH